MVRKQLTGRLALPTRLSMAFSGALLLMVMAMAMTMMASVMAEILAGLMGVAVKAVTTKELTMMRL